jgi:hypothetical protein
MTTFDDLIIAAEVESKQAQKQQERALATVKFIHEKAKNAGRSNLSMEEDVEVASSMEAHSRAVKDQEGADHKLVQLRAAVEAERMADRKLEQEREGGRDPKDTAKPPTRNTGGAIITSEARTYHPGVDRKGGGFIRDVAKQFLYRDMEAETRLSRHMQEERVERAEYLQRAAGDTNTGNWAGLTVPQYLTELYAPAVANLRPFADVCNHHDLPATGMTVNISRITTASSAAAQANELDAVSGTSMDDTLLTENIQTAGGQQTISRQAIDRSTGVEAIVMDDLFRRYATNLDNTLINGAVTGLAAVAATQTFTNTAPTTPMIYSQTIMAASTVESVLLGFAQPNAVIMHSRRWYSMLSAVTPNWPMITTNNSVPVQASGTNFDQTYGKGVRGMLATGLAAVVDNNVTVNNGVGTNQDQMYIVPTQECHLWEDPDAPVFIRAEQPKAANLGVLLVLYGYYAWSFRRYGSGAMVKIDGTGLVTPTFLGA